MTEGDYEPESFARVAQFVIQVLHHVQSKSKPELSHTMKWLETASSTVTAYVSSSWGTLTALALLAIWGISTGLVGDDTAYKYMDQLFSAISFTLLFLVQRSQSKDGMAMHTKINELLAAVHRASPRLINLEDMGEDEIRALHAAYQELQSADSGSHSVEEVAELVHEKQSA